MNSAVIFNNIVYIMSRNGTRIDANTFIMLDAAYNKETHRITTSHLDVVISKGDWDVTKDIKFAKGNENILYKLYNRLEKHLTEEDKRIKELLISNHIELTGIVYKDDNGKSYDYASWGDLNDEQQKITLQNVLFNNFGRKAKITIEFEE